MIAVQLQAHPADPLGAVEGLQVSIEQPTRDRLHLRYMLWAPLDELVLPEPSQPGRRDGLWETTCFELFLRPQGHTGYLEFNFSPSSAWAAYSFEDRRVGMAPLLLPRDPEIYLSAASDLLDMEVALELPLSADGYSAALAAVIEEATGHKSYWALAHPPEGPPDFHHPACFVLELPPAPGS